MDSYTDYMTKCWRVLDRFDGQRVRLTKSHDSASAGTTGRICGSEDGALMIFDTPIPRWAEDYEDTRTGRMIIADCEDYIEAVAESYPIHSGHPDKLTSRKA